MFGKVKKFGGFINKHKKGIAVGAGAVALGVAAGMATGYVPTPELISSAVTMATTTAAEHPLESVAVGGAVVGYVAPKAAKGTYRKLKSMRAPNPRSLAEQAVSKVKGALPGKSGGEQASAQEPKINWDRAKFFITET